MKSNLLTLTILLNIFFLDCAISSENKHKDDARDCPKNQSSFTKHDLYMIVSDVSDVKFNVLPNITAAYYDLATHASDDMLKEFNEFQKQLEKNQNHLIEVLENMGDTRVKKIVPLVNTAAASLKEFPGVDADFEVLYDKTTIMLNNLEKYKKICQMNNCDKQLRSALPLQMSRSALLKSADSEYICTTVEFVQQTTKNSLIWFEALEIEAVRSNITNNDKTFAEELSGLKQSLRKAVLEQFGITMYEILSLDDDYFHFMNSLLDFNSKSYTSALKKNSVTIEYKLLDFADKLEKYRIHCLNCSQVPRRRSLGVDYHNILDEVITDKIDEINHVVQANISDIFRELNAIVHNEQYIIAKTIAALEPLNENAKERMKVEKQALESLVASVPLNQRQRAERGYYKSEDLIYAIDQALRFLKPY